MVRVNLINPKFLTDQHLVAEYAEILILAEYIRNYPDLEGIPKRYCLGEGHQRFFKDKVGYLRKRHEKLKQEMMERGFKPKRTLSLKGFSRKNLGSWRPAARDYLIIRKRLIEKVKKKPGFYRYYREPRSQTFLLALIRDGTGNLVL